MEFYIFVKGECEIPDVVVPNQSVRTLRELFAMHNLLKNCLPNKNRAHSLLKQHGKQLNKSNLNSKREGKLVIEIINGRVSQIELELF